MDDLTLAPLSEEDAPALFLFEVANRAWFEQQIGPRPDTYWEVTSLTRIIRDQLAAGEAMYLIKRNDDILGRLNITGVHSGTGQLGVRIGQKYCGKGVASGAVRLAVDRARSLGLWALEAQVSLTHPAMGRALEKNDFRRTEERRINGADYATYRRDLD